MSHSRVLIRGAFLSGGGMIFSMFGAMVVLKLVTNAGSLSEDDVGVYVMLLIAGDFLLLLNNFGMRSALPKLISAAPEEEKPRLVGTVLGFQSAISGICGAALLLFWWLASEPRLVAANPDLHRLYPYAWVLGPLLLFSTLRELLLAILAGLHCYGRRTAGMAALAVSQALLVATLVWWRGGQLTQLMTCLLAAHALASIWLYLSLPMGRRPCLDGPSYRKGLRFAAPLYLNNLLNMAFQRLDTVVVGLLLGVEAAAFFEVGAKKVPQYAGGLLNAALVPFLPGIAGRIAAGDRAGALHMLRRFYGAFSFIGYTGLFFTLIVQEPLVRFLSAGPFLAGVPVLGWIMAAGVLVLQAGWMGQSLVALGRPQFIVVANLGLAALSLGLSFLLIPRHGMHGAGYAAIAAALFSNVAHTCFVRHCGMAFPWLDWLKPNVFMLAATGLIWAGGAAMPARVLAFAVFPALCLAGGVVSVAQIRQAVSDAMGRDATT